MRKIMFLWLVVFIALYATQTFSPIDQIKVDGIVRDIVVHDQNLIIGTDNGKLQVYNYHTKHFIKEIVLPEVKDFVGDNVPARVYSVDNIEGRYLLLSDSGKSGYANLWIHENNTTIQLFGAEEKKAIIKARFIDKDHILLGYLSNEAALYEVQNKKERYRVQLSESKFSDFALNDDKSKAVYGCESGVLWVIAVQSGEKIKELRDINKDNTYKVSFQKDMISAAGQDRRGALYRYSSGRGDFIEGSFLIYATALSPNATQVAFSMDEQNNISIYDVPSKAKTALLSGQKSTLNTIIFIDETTLFSASDDNTVMMWKLKEKE